MLVRVSCVVSRGDLPLNMTWLKDNHAIKYDLSVKITAFDEYSSVLSIDPLNSKHNGNYTCVAKNFAGTDMFSAGITVREHPKWIVKPNDTKVLIGHSTILQCLTTGFPLPSTMWYKVEGLGADGTKNKISETENYEIFTNGSLHIKNATLTHAGYYFCLAENSIGSISGMALLSISSVPPKLEKISLNKTVRLGEPVKFTCIAHGDQPMSFKWFVGKEITEAKSGQSFLVHQLNENGKIISELAIDYAERKYSTNITCLVENKYGKENATFHLTVLEKPDTVNEVKIIEATNRTVIVGWKEPFNGNSPIIKYILQYKHVEDKWNSEVRNLTLPGHKLQSAINGLKPSSKYQVRVIAENKIGLGNPSNSIEISMAEQAPSGFPLNVTAVATDASSLKISWMPPRKEFWNGIIRGYYVGFKPTHSLNDYTFQMLEVPEDYTSILSLPLTGLEKFTQYNIVVQAFNDGGKGPQSSPLIAITSESVPTKPPQNVMCSVLSSESIHILWQSPPSHSIHGILKGYKVIYKPVEEHLITRQEVKNTGLTTKLTIKNLEKFTNYSLQILGTTNRGDGVKSEPIFCKTAEDVPDAPADVKALPASSQSIMLAWKTPSQPNGIILKYIIYFTQSKTSQINGNKTLTVQGNVTNHIIDGLRKGETYNFWVTASTIVGESNKSKIVTQSTSGEMTAAKIAGFNTSIEATEGDDVLLSCRYVGVPVPQNNGLILASDIKYHLMKDGSLLIKDTNENDINNYTCEVENELGQDQITYALQIQSTPQISNIEITLTTTSSIDIQWKIRSTGGSPILGYRLYYKNDNNDWKTTEIDASSLSYHLDGLRCGTKYKIELLAYNKLGQGKLTSAIDAKTKGGVPVPPTKTHLLEESSTFVSLNLDSWLVDKCPINYFVVEYKSQINNQWHLLSDEVKPEKRKLVLPNLLPANWYNLRMIAHSSAGTSVAEYTFATLTSDGSTIAPDTMFDTAQFRPIAFQFELKHVIAIGISILIVILLAVIICLCCQTKSSKQHKGSKLGRRFLNGIAGSESGSDTTYDGSYGYSVGQSTLGRDSRRNMRNIDLTPYATANLTDHYKPEELALLNMRHSMNTNSSILPGMTVPFYPQSHPNIPADGFGNGIFPSTVDVVNFQGQLPQFPSVSSVNDSFSVNPSMMTKASKPSLPNTPKRVLNGNMHMTPLMSDTDQKLVCETTFNFPNHPDTVATNEKEDSAAKYDAPWDNKGKNN